MNTVIEPTEMTIADLFNALPAQGIWTETQYLELALNTNRLVEFSDGIVESLPMPSRIHQKSLGYLYRMFYAFVSKHELGEVLFSALPLRLWANKVREPDLMFIFKENYHLLHDDYWLWADLVMEIVSPNNHRHDYVTKRAEYALAGIREYWIVDPREKQRKITVLMLENEQYVEHGVFIDGETADSPLTNFTVEVTAALNGN